MCKYAVNMRLKKLYVLAMASVFGDDRPYQETGLNGVSFATAADEFDGYLGYEDHHGDETETADDIRRKIVAYRIRRATGESCPVTLLVTPDYFSNLTLNELQESVNKLVAKRQEADAAAEAFIALPTGYPDEAWYAAAEVARQPVSFEEEAVLEALEEEKNNLIDAIETDDSIIQTVEENGVSAILSDSLKKMIGLTDEQLNESYNNFRVMHNDNHEIARLILRHYGLEAFILDEEKTKD